MFAEVFFHLGEVRLTADAVELLQRRFAFRLRMPEHVDVVEVRDADVELWIQPELIDVLRARLGRIEHPEAVVVFVQVDGGRRQHRENALIGFQRIDLGLEINELVPLVPMPVERIEVDDREPPIVGAHQVVHIRNRSARSDDE